MNPRENIVSTFSELSAELQRAAEFSLQNTNQLVVLSMRAFASEAGVKPATLLRLAQRLGYNGWGELKDAFIDELGLRNDTYVSKAEKLIAKGTQPQLYEEVFQAHQANLAFTQHENHQAMEQAVTLLDAAENVYICGFRASFPIAWSLFYVYRLFNRQASLIDGLASNIEVFTRELTAQDCLLLTSFAPYSRESLDVLRAAQQAGATIVAITDSPVSPLAHAAVLYRQPVVFPLRGVRHGAGRVFTGDAGRAPWSRCSE